MRALWRGETVCRRGLVRVEQARLYTRPATPPPIIGAAVTARTAAWVGEWADGLITVSRPPDQLREVVDAFRDAGGEGKPMFLKVQLSYARTDEEARRGAWEQWRTNVFPNRVLTELRAPADFDAAAELVAPEDLDESVRISADAECHVEWLSKDVELGFSRLFLHNVNREHARFIEDFGERVIPALRRA
jgi:alkanesulfonate monooxygenase SsuD/methylene tetrahydromethanopterin reductase-like flavin-dependent oxidoreductase (luciferase family)